MLFTEPLWQRLIILAPALVVGIGLITVVLILLGRAFVETVRESGHKNLIYVGLVVTAVFIGILTYLGVELPREG
jgi:ABC-type anion transport system duplicated permease subunit